MNIWFHNSCYLVAPITRNYPLTKFLLVTHSVLFKNKVNWKLLNVIDLKTLYHYFLSSTLSKGIDDESCIVFITFK